MHTLTILDLTLHEIHAAFSIEEANEIIYKISQMPTFKMTNPSISDDYTSYIPISIACLFVWEESEQGFEYWDNIADKIAKEVYDKFKWSRVMVI
jgi:hypothetical protein